MRWPLFDRGLAVAAAAIGLLAPIDTRAPIGAAEPIRFEAADEAMGTTFSVVLYGHDRAALETSARAALDEAHRLDALLSNYRPDSEWSAVNRAAASGPATASAELFALLSACLEYSRLSEGAFDITVGPLVEVWGFHKGEGTLPRRSDVASALSRVGYRLVSLDPTRRTVRFGRPGMALDPGGIGKGYAVDRMIDLLKQRGIASALVSAGGSSIYGLGTPAGEAGGWRVTVRDPDNARPAAEVWLENMSISTSGGYEKFFHAGDRTYPHIIDPRTGYPAAGVSTVSVVAPRAIDSEAWTKPYFINGRDWTARHLPDRARVFMCDDTRERRCAWIDPP
jgi:thiamine biosynthesis lipoprotein